MIIGDPLLYQGLLFRAKTDLADLTARFADCQHQYWMALAAIALGTPRLVPDDALQQRATEQLNGGKLGGQLVPASHDIFMFH